MLYISQTFQVLTRTANTLTTIYNKLSLYWYIFTRVTGRYKEKINWVGYVDIEPPDHYIHYTYNLSVCQVLYIINLKLDKFSKYPYNGSYYEFTAR